MTRAVAPLAHLDMPAAAWPEPGRDRLQVVDPRSGRSEVRRVDDLPELLGAGDLLVLNDAATLPARLSARARGRAVEVRLTEWQATGPVWAALMGEGSWRDDTDLRPAPPLLEVGERLTLPAAAAQVVEVSPLSPRLVRIALAFEGDARLSWLFEHGRMVQYSYAADELPPHLAQSAFAGRAWAVEAPSAGRPLSWRRLDALRARGVRVAHLTHGAGLSATGDPALDAALPLPERYALPARTVAELRAARTRGGRVIAVGTTVVRALESAALRGLPAGEGVARLRIDARHRLAIVDGLLTNMHGPGESHFDLATALAPPAVLAAAHKQAVAAGLRAHEFGDIALLLAGTLPT